VLTIFPPAADSVNVRSRFSRVQLLLHFFVGMRTRDHLFSALRARVSDAAAAWLEEAMARAATGSPSELLHAYTSASTRLGDAPLGPAAAVTVASGAAVPLDDWTLEDAGRAVLLLARAEAARDAAVFAADAIECYEQGDAREQRSWLRGVALLPDPPQYLMLVIDACRTNILPVFEAVACGNPYPAEHFPERNFNQLVLKALFNGVALKRILGLERRVNPELARMASDYAAERRAAGRSVPADISLVTKTTTPGVIPT
jgi:hypothetical protein